MSELRRVSGLDLNEQMDYQWREWRVQRVAWALFTLVLLASLLGLFGQGPLSKASAGEPGAALSLKYERIDRYRASTDLTVSLGPNVAQDGNVRLSLDQAFLERVQVDQIVPQPESVEVGANRVTYVFRISDPAESAEIHMDFQHERAGMARGDISLEGGPSLQFASFVFP